MLSIEQTDKEIIIRLPLDLGVADIQRMLDYLAYKQAVKDSQATPQQIASLAKEVKEGWWEKNRHRFPGLMEASR